MEREPYGIDGVPKTRRIPHRITKKLGGSHKVYESSTRNNEEAVQQEIKELSRVQDWKQHVARKQEYLFE